MVARHSKLRAFFLDGEVVQAIRQREFIAKAHPIVEYTKANHHVALFCYLVQRYGQLVVVVSNLFLLAPHRLPSFVHTTCIYLRKRESTQ